MWNKFKMNKLSRAIYSVCALSLVVPAISNAANTKIDNDDVVYQPADAPETQFDDHEQYPEVFLVSDLRKLDGWHQVCFISKMQEGQFLSEESIRPPVVSTNDRDIPVDPRVVVVAPFEIINSSSGMPLFPILNQKATTGDVEERHNHRVLLNFSNFYRAKGDLQSDDAWLDPQKNLPNTGYYRVCGTKIADRVVRKKNFYWITLPRKLQGNPDTMPEIDVDFFEKIDYKNFLSDKLTTREAAYLADNVFDARTPEKVARGDFDGQDVYSTFSDHKNNMYNGVNITLHNLLFEVLVNRTPISEKELEEAAERIRAKRVKADN